MSGQGLVIIFEKKKKKKSWFNVFRIWPLNFAMMVGKFSNN